MAVGKALTQAEILMLAIEKEKRSFTHLSKAARACTSPAARSLYNQLALDELRHLLTLVSLMDGFSDRWLEELDLTLPQLELPAGAEEDEEAILRSTMAEEERSKDLFAELAQGIEDTEILLLLQDLRDEEEGHYQRLVSMLYGREVRPPLVTKWLRRFRRLMPRERLH